MAVARSGRPSRLKSSMVSPEGSVPAGCPGCGVNVPSPLPSSTVTVLSSMLAVARSGLPSRLKSPTASATGWRRSPDGWVAVRTRRLPSPSRTATCALVESAAARSGFPSRSKSPTATATGFAVPRKYISPIPPNVPSPLPRNHETTWELRAAAATSARPSRSKSPTATERGFWPVPSVGDGENVPSPTASRTLSVWLAKLAVARSDRPSRLKSPSAIADGAPPVGGCAGCAAKPPAPSARSTVTWAAPWSAVAMSGCPLRSKSPTARSLGAVPAPVAGVRERDERVGALDDRRVQPHRHLVVVGVGGGEVGQPVAVEVRRPPPRRGRVPVCGWVACGVNAPLPSPSSTVTCSSPGRRWRGRGCRRGRSPRPPPRRDGRRFAAGWLVG